MARGNQIHKLKAVGRLALVIQRESIAIVKKRGERVRFNKSLVVQDIK